MSTVHKSVFQQMLEEAMSNEPNFMYLGESGNGMDMSTAISSYRNSVSSPRPSQSNWTQSHGCR